MPSQDSTTSELEQLLFGAIATKDLDRVEQIVRSNPKLDLNCMDKDELTPLQHACHTGDLRLAQFLLDHGAEVSYTRRNDGYTPLMFAAIGARSDIVRLLLEHGVDTTTENCVHRTAAQMAAFVGQSKVVSIINSWIPRESSVDIYTRCRELEDKPRIPNTSLADLLHNYIVYPSIHPIKLMLFIKENNDLVKHSSEFIYVLENLSSRALKPPQNDETLSLKYYYLSHLIQCCRKGYNARRSAGGQDIDSFDRSGCDKCLDILLKRLIKRDRPEEFKPNTKLLDQFIVNCIMKFPYVHLAIFKTMTFALSKREFGDLTALAILTQTLNGPRVFDQSAEACAVCGEVDKNRKCSKCKSVHYCGTTCQKIDWFQHKKVCKDPEEIPLISKNGGDQDE